MNAPLASARALDGAVLNRAFVRAGLARFGLTRLAAPSGLFAELAADAGLHCLLDSSPDDWAAACAALAARAPSLGGAWGALLTDYRLQLPEWFALALAAEVEADHAVGRALAELQAPDADGRPALHLLDALAATLFDAALPPLAWPHHALVQRGLASLSGDLPLVRTSLRVDPRLAALLAGDRRPWADFTPLPPDTLTHVLPATLLTELDAAVHLVQQGAARLVVLRGSHGTGRAAAARLGAALGLLPVTIPPDPWRSTPIFAAACRYGGWLPVFLTDLGPGDTFSLPTGSLEQTPQVLVTGQDGSVDTPDAIELDIPPLERHERHRAWQAVLGPDAPPVLADHARLDGPAIHALAQAVGRDAARRHEMPALAHLRRARSTHGAERLRQLAQPVHRDVGPDGLVLPAETARQFEHLVRRCRMRERLWDGLGPSLASPAPGVRALFAGESGAGKTLAASRLATELGAPLYRVDLAAILNKYVGETEKNLGRLLDEAATLDALLLMDEADALFGRRSEGKDGGERYANMMTNFLLTRIESHPGIVILTTNARNRLDAAFTRRFDTIIEFPLPGVAERLRLWHAHLGARSPGEAACGLLATYSDLPGGHIRNAVLYAVALSPRPPGTAVEITLLVAGLAEEYRKLGRTPPPQLAQIGE